MKVRLKAGGDALAYVLIEHASKPSPALPLQLAGYMIRAWRRYAGTSHRKLRNLPPIIPIVVTTVRSAWSAPEGLTDMIASDDVGLVFLPGERYILRNLGTMDVEALSGNAALRAGFIALRREALDHMAVIAQGLPEGSDLRRQVLEYILRVYDVSMDELAALLRRENLPDLEDLMGTIAETLHMEGKAEGHAEGLIAGERLGLVKGKAEGLRVGKAEGRAEGRVEGEAAGEARAKSDTLRRLLERRFGSLPSDVVARIDAASTAQLGAWLDAVLDADTLDAVFGSGRSRRSGRD